MAVTTDASPFTSVTASPMKPHNSEDLPLELKIPLPSSSVCSGEDEEQEKHLGDTVQLSQGPSITEQERGKSERTEHTQETHEDTNLEIPESEGLLDSLATTLEKLARLAESELYQRRRTHSGQVELDKLIYTCGVEKRLIRTFKIAYGDMIDQYKTDDQAGFAGLYEACENLKQSSDMLNQDAGVSGLAPTMGATPSDEMDKPSGIQMLPKNEQESVLAFLDRIRTEPYFLAERISSLSSVDLMALTSSYHPAGIDFSILQNHSHGKSHYFSRDSQMMKLSRRMDNLHHFHNQDPFFTLLYCVFDSSASSGSDEFIRREDIWSTTCARIIIDGFSGSKPGSDEFAIASLDAFANFQEWALKPKVELYILKLMGEGSFLLEPPANQPVNFNEPMETQNAKTAVAEADFFEDALIRLFDLLTAGTIQRAVPASVLSFAHAVLQRIEDPKLRARAQQFIVIRWYFATFLSSVIVYPELHGIMMVQHIGDTARRLILQKLIVKMQERVFEVVLPSNNDALVHPRIRDSIKIISQSFAPQPLSEDHESLPMALDNDHEASTRFLMLTSSDIIGLVRILCPDPSPTQDRHDLAAAVPFSERPSTAGSSTLVAGSSDVGSAVTVPGLQITAGDPDHLEDPGTHNSAEEEKYHFTDDGKLGPQGKIKESPMKDADSQLRMTCNTLNDMLALDRNSSSAFSSHSWTFISYCNDAARRSNVLKIKPHENGCIDLSTTSWRGEQLTQEQLRDGNEKLREAILTLLTGGDQFGLDPMDVSAILNDLPPSSSHDPLEILLEVALDRAHSNLDPGDAHKWWTSLRAYRYFLATHPPRASHTLLQGLCKEIQDAIDDSARIAKDCEVQHRSLNKLCRYNKSLLDRMAELRDSLRVKMWYTSDVRHSATYEEALYVTRALRTMANSRKPKQSTGISTWARQRLRGSNVHDRAQVQTLEAMVATKDHGGLNKLADEQVELTSRWLTRKSIENFCKGEERIHRFCFEIQRAIGKIAGTSLLESPVLWSSNLFRGERASFDSPIAKSSVLGSPYSPHYHPSTPFSSSRLHSPISGVPDMPSRTMLGPSLRSPTTNFNGFWNKNQQTRQSAGLGLYGGQANLPPTPTSPPISWLNSPPGSGVPLYVTTPSLPFNPNLGAGQSSGTNKEETLPAKRLFTEQIKKRLSSLLISDLGYLLWNHGSETDTWVNDNITDATKDARTAATWNAVNSHSSTATATPKPENESEGDDVHKVFPFSVSYAALLQRVSLTPDPYAKLALLYELENLILKSMGSPLPGDPIESQHTRPSRSFGSLGFRSKSVPRTKTTSLEEVIANCTERRAGTLNLERPQAASILDTLDSAAKDFNNPDTDDLVVALVSIFRDPKIRPTTLYRDLQYIAAFVPAETLDKGPQGKAFWDAGIAALALKEDLCDSLIRRANDITTAYDMSPLSSRDRAADHAIESTTLREAANSWLIAAKEGSPVAARELGLFYLTYPDLIPRITLPFSKSKDVFGSVTSNDSRAMGKERGALNPYTFAVVYHWMETAANGGDKDARAFLKENGAFNSGR